eukprot:jgi/Psemu1/6248/gm1.6248_g
MAPLRRRQRGSGVNGRSRDVVSQVVEDKLKLKLGTEQEQEQELPGDVLEATRSSLRVLKIRHPIGSFGKYDNETKRACALLEYEVRDYNNRNSSNSNSNGDNSNNNSSSSSSNNNCIEISMEKLAKAAFMKLKDFRDFHEKVGNFRDNLRAKAAHTSTTQTNEMGSSLLSASKTPRAVASKRGNERNVTFRESTVASLAIQMGAFVPNSSYVALRAQKLFDDAVELLKNSSKKAGGLHGLLDMQRNQSSYEAACFYLVATGASGSGKQDNKPRRRRLKSLKDLDDNDGEDNQQLDLSTFLDVTKEVASQFQTVLDYVKELQSEIQSTTNANQKRSVAASRSRSLSRTSSSSSYSQARNSSKTTASRKRSRNDVSGIAERTASQHTNADDAGTDVRDGKSTTDIDAGDNGEYYSFDMYAGNSHRYRVRKSRPNPIYEEWKSTVLDAACAAAKHKMIAGMNENDSVGDEGDNSLEPHRVLDFATRDILTRHGLL